MEIHLNDLPGRSKATDIQYWLSCVKVLHTVSFNDIINGEIPFLFIYFFCKHASNFWIICQYKEDGEVPQA